MDKSYDFLLKIVLIGSAGTGKTNFQSKICRNQFNMESQASVGIEFGIRDVVIESHTMRLQIWDTAGQEKYISMTSGYFRNASGVFLIYDISKRESFEMVQKWLTISKQYVNSHTTFFLIGNKCDLINLREVSRQQAHQFAIQNNLLFGECSAATGENVDQLLVEMITNIYQVMMSNEVVIDNPISRTSLCSQDTNNNVKNQCCL